MWSGFPNSGYSGMLLNIRCRSFSVSYVNDDIRTALDLLDLHDVSAAYALLRTRYDLFRKVADKFGFNGAGAEA